MQMINIRQFNVFKVKKFSKQGFITLHYVQVNHKRLGASSDLIPAPSLGLCRD